MSAIMTVSGKSISRIYTAVLDQGLEGRDRYYEELRRRGIPATPDDEEGHLYSPNPVVVPRGIVDAMTADLNRFCARKCELLRDAGELLDTLPPELRAVFASPGVADRILDDLSHAHPFACLDAYLVETPTGLDPAYLEWQTFPAYPATALVVLEAMRDGFGGVEAAGGSLTAVGGETLEELRGQVRASLLHGVEDDPRRGVIVDFEPDAQETRREFGFTTELTGGKSGGFGVIDPRQVVYRDATPCYRREGSWIPIESVFSRLVHDDLETKLLPALGADEREAVARFFGDGDRVRWRVHPLHFLYGTKADFPRFHAEELSPAIPASEIVTRELIDELKRRGADHLKGKVQKPVEGHGGRAIIRAPSPSDLEIGHLLQDVIQPADCHLTLDGPRAPEIRVMGLPDGDGRLICSSVFTRVKAPGEFRSNAGVTARARVPGTGEGYAIIGE